MRYFKIYHNNVTVNKAYLEESKEEFEIALACYVNQNMPDLEEDVDNETWDLTWSEVYIDAHKKACSESGLDAGDYNLYIRDDDADMYDIPRE